MRMTTPQGRRAQTALEYILVFAALFAVAGILGVLLRAVKAEGERSGEMVSSGYP